MLFLHHDSAHELILGYVTDIAKQNNAYTYYLVQNAFGRFSVYIRGCKPDHVLTVQQTLSKELGAWFDGVHSLDDSTIIAKQLRHVARESNEVNLFFVESFIAENSWSGVPSTYVKSQALKSKIVCFYSFKGGVGRTTAMVMSAIALARQGKRVALIDFDLEAPGVANLLQTKELPNYGLIDFLLETSVYYQEYDKAINIDEYIYTCSSSQIVGAKRGEIYVVPAYGKSTERDVDSYKRKLLRFDLNTPIYHNKETPIDILLEKVDSFVEPDYIFIDSRSGLHQVGGVTISRYADLVVMLFYGSQQNITGMKMVFPVISSNKKDFILVNSQVPNNTLLKKMERELYIQGAYDALKLCRPDYEEDIDSKEAEHYPIDITYTESAAFIDSTEQLLASYEEAKNEFEGLASAISTFLYEAPIEENTLSFNKAEIIMSIIKLTPEVPSAEDEFKTEHDFENRFYPTPAYSFIFEPRKFLILGDKGMGKTALFLMLKHDNYAKKVAQFLRCDIKHYQNTSWIVGTDIQRNFIDESHLVVEKNSIRSFWLYEILKSLYSNLKELSDISLDPNVTALLEMKSTQNVVNAFDTSIQYLLSESIKQVSSHLEQANRSVTIIYDSLDRIFPDSNRGRFLSELIQIWYDYANTLLGVRAKIFLRSDIYHREITITDKVKLGNYSASIKWEYDQLFAMVWKRLVSSSGEFKRVYESVALGELNENQNDELGFVPQASEEINRNILTRMMGVKMGGGNKTTTYNWFKNRLSDTNENIVPRSMLDIFAVAAKRESESKTKATLNTGVIIKPRSFEEALPDVSLRRVIDMKEEHPQYTKLFDDLKNTIKRSPVDEDVLKNALKQVGFSKPEEEIKTLIEIGIIRAYKRTLQDHVRYHFPDIYLNGLGLRRTGMK